jgi:integrase/recombinase XerD
MSNEIRNQVIMELQGEFSAEQLKIIDLAVAKAMRGYKIEKEETLPAATVYEMPLDVREFLARKKMKGCSDGTLKQYRDLLVDFTLWLKKDLRTSVDLDILAYLDYRGKVGASKRTLDCKRLILSSFFTYMHETGKMAYNPSKTVDPVKYKAKVREPLNDMELEKVRSACRTLREKALFEVLYATGGRVSEIVGINYAEIDKQTRSVVITGKGDQERYVFLNAKAMLAIENYIKSREDESPALFVGARKPHNRLGKEAIQRELKAIGERSGIGRPVFPHLLRHTFATDMLEHGASLDEVSEMLGHKKLDTTKIYAKISTNALAISYKKHHAA